MRDSAGLFDMIRGDPFFRISRKHHEEVPEKRLHSGTKIASNVSLMVAQSCRERVNVAYGTLFFAFFFC